jgi:hypothetical protein
MNFIRQYTFENVRNFAYLGVLLNDRGIIRRNKRIMTGRLIVSSLKVHFSQD